MRWTKSVGGGERQLKIGHDLSQTGRRDEINTCYSMMMMVITLGLLLVTFKLAGAIIHAGEVRLSHSTGFWSTNLSRDETHRLGILIGFFSGCPLGAF